MKYFVSFLKRYKVIFLLLLVFIISIFYLLKISSPVIVQQEKNSNCASLGNNLSKMKCWENSLQDTIQSKGISESFDLFAKFYQEDPYFAQNCHGFTHEIGEASYKLYKQGKDFDVDEKVSYCSFGFFHGFIEAMFADQGTLNGARDFCNYIDEKLKGKTSTFTACMHGIGHGVTDGDDPDSWGSAEKIIAPGLSLCEQVAKTDYEKRICGTGVFNSLEGMYGNLKYKLTLDPINPFKICREQTKDYFKLACYSENDFLLSITHEDFSKAAKYAESIKEDEYADGAIDNLGTAMGYRLLRKTNYDYAIDVCNSLESRLRVACVAGLGAGFMTAGVPDKEYIKAIELCKSSKVTSAERQGCFTRVMALVYGRYSADIQKKACDLAGQDAISVGYCKT